MKEGRFKGEAFQFTRAVAEDKDGKRELESEDSS